MPEYRPSYALDFMLANALSLTIPLTLVARADEVIE